VAGVRPKKLPICAVLLAGGRGTRFWPRSRTRTPKQLLDITSGRTMLHETVQRVRPMFPPGRIWVVTNKEQAAAVRRELPHVPHSHILSEPTGRNTAAAIGLAAIHLKREHGDAVMAVLPADHHIADTRRYLRIARAALALARVPGNLVVLGIPPTHAETGFGYIERGEVAARPGGLAAYDVRRFTEKPALPTAQRYVASRRYFWNAGMFFWRVSTFLENLREFLPATYAALEELALTTGTARYAGALQQIYPRLENISVDYAIMEPASRSHYSKTAHGKRQRSQVLVLPANVGWSDIGSWAAVYELLARRRGENVSRGRFLALDATGNFFWSPGKFIAAIGVHDLVLVETGDALLLCPRDRAQDVSKIVKWMEERRHSPLL
jgi:mannose-1-phosphate guanylyltransferase